MKSQLQIVVKAKSVAMRQTFLPAGNLSAAPSPRPDRPAVHGPQQFSQGLGVKDRGEMLGLRRLQAAAQCAGRVDGCAVVLHGEPEHPPDLAARPVCRLDGAAVLNAPQQRQQFSASNERNRSVPRYKGTRRLPSARGSIPGSSARFPSVPATQGRWPRSCFLPAPAALPRPTPLPPTDRCLPQASRASQVPFARVCQRDIGARQALRFEPWCPRMPCRYSLPLA